MADIPTIASFSDKQRKAAKAIAGGMTTREVAEAVEVSQRTIQHWKADDENFGLLVAYERDKQPGGWIPATVRRQMGHLDMNGVGELTVASLLMIVNFDPKGLGQPGNWTPLDELPPEVRACIKKPGTEKNAPEFYDRIAAARVLKEIVMAWQEAKMEANGRTPEEEEHALDEPGTSEA